MKTGTLQSWNPAPVSMLTADAELSVSSIISTIASSTFWEVKDLEIIMTILAYLFP